MKVVSLVDQEVTAGRLAAVLQTLSKHLSWDGKTKSLRRVKKLGVGFFDQILTFFDRHRGYRQKSDVRHT